MSDRDFIIQEIRKLFKEQENFGLDSSDSKLFGDETQKRALEAILAASTPEEQKQIRASVKGKDLSKLNVRWNSNTGTMTVGNFTKKGIPTDIMSWVQSGGAEPASLTKAKQAAAAPQKLKPKQGAQTFMAQYEKLQNKLIPGYSDNNPKHVKKWKNSQQFKTIQSITTGPNKDKDPNVNIKKAIDYINSELSKKPATPASSTQMVANARDARSTEDLPFEEIVVPKEYEERYKQITAGMDRGETGDCTSINNAAIEILGSDPRVIYTALINSGILPANYVPPSKPCDGLSKLIRNFQYLATQGKLRYQKKIDASGELTKGLTYKPTVDTPDLQQQAVAAVGKQGGPTIKQQQRVAQKAKPGQQVADRPSTINEQMVTVDGKIGSRTAKLLKIYASKESFDKLKDKAGVKPKPKPKPEPKKEKRNCQINFKNLDELTNKTALAVMGVHYCSLDEKYNIAIGGKQYRALAGSILSGEEGPDPATYIRDAQELARTIKKNLANKQEGLASYAISDAKEEKKQNLRIYGKKYPHLSSVLKNSFSDKVFKFYSGTYNSQNIVSFSFVNVSGQTKPIIYSYSDSKDNEYGDVAEYYRGINYNKWMTVPPEKRADTFTVGPQAKKSIESINKYVGLHLQSLRVFYKALLAIKDPRGQIEDLSDTPVMLEECKEMVSKYMKSLQQFKQALNSFVSGASEEALNALIASAGTVSVSQRSAVHGDMG